MTYSWLGKWAEGLAIPVFLVICIGPALVLVLDLLGTAPASAWLSSRQLGLLGTSAAYAAVSAWGALVVGVLIAAFMRSRPGILSQFIKVILLLMLPMPTFVHAAGWRTAWRFFNDLLGSDFTGQGWAAAVIITMMAYLPIAVGAAWLGLHAVDRDLISAARVCRSDIHVFTEIILPLAAPFLAAGGAVIAVLSLLDYTIPSLCQVNVYALEIFADFSAGSSPGSSFLMAVPLIAVNALIVGWLVSSLRNAGLSGVNDDKTGSCSVWPVWFWIGLGIGTLFALIQAGLPLITLIFTALSGDALWRQTGVWPMIGYSVAVALGTGLAAVIIAYPVARGLDREKNVFLWPFILLPMVLPAPLTGIGLVKLGTIFPWMYGNDFMPVLAGLARFLPLAVLIIWAGLKRLDPMLMAAGQVMQAKPGQALFRVELPLLAPILLAALLLLFVLDLGELGATLMVVPPGRTTLTITIYNYLHYGASGSVAALCLFTALLGALVWAGGVRALNRVKQPASRI